MIKSMIVMPIAIQKRINPIIRFIFLTPPFMVLNAFPGKNAGKKFLFTLY